MKSQWITNEGNNRLILIFLGWGAYGSMVSDVTKYGYDILALWDYRDEDFDFSNISSYDEICVIAWSFGVMEANRLLSTLKFTSLIAVNGTSFPIDDERGIPLSIFEGTLTNMDVRTFRKFFRRMCGGAKQMAELGDDAPQRTLNDLIEELSVLGQRAMEPQRPLDKWTKAVIADEDMIIPTNNQIKAWQHIPHRLTHGTHLPNWQEIIDTELIDKDLVKERFDASTESYDANANVQKEVARLLWERARQHVVNQPLNILEVGCGTGLLTALYARDVELANLTLIDVIDRSLTLPTDIDYRYVQHDAETFIDSVDDESIDLIISSSAMQWFNAPSRFIAEAAKKLRRGGVLAISTYGIGTCHELGVAGSEIKHYPDTETIIAWLPSSMELKLAETQVLKESFDSVADVFNHMRLTGVNAVKRATNPGEVRALMRNYPTDGEGKAYLTFCPIFLIAKKL